MTDNTLQAYKALQKWAYRLNQWEYSVQLKRNKGKKLKQFSPNAFSLLLIQACNDIASEKISADEAMALLHTVEGKTEINMCMEAGF